MKKKSTQKMAYIIYKTLLFLFIYGGTRILCGYNFSYFFKLFLPVVVIDIIVIALFSSEITLILAQLKLDINRSRLLFKANKWWRRNRNTPALLPACLILEHPHQII